jgi:RNA polymerase sigma-70 factor (ECF subfamily)
MLVFEQSSKILYPFAKNWSFRGNSRSTGTFRYPFHRNVSSYLYGRDSVPGQKILLGKNNSKKRICEVSQEAVGEDLGNNTLLDAREHHGQDLKNNAVELVQRCRGGDEGAFALIADQYGGLLLRTAYLLLRDEEAAKDVVQEALILAWGNMDKLREPAFLRAWLIKIVVNQTAGVKRQLARKAALLREQFTQQYINTTIHTADLQRGYLEDTIDLEQAIGQLPLNQRVVIVLFYYHRMTMPEIATLLDVAENTLRKRLQSALAKIRRVLQEDMTISQNGNLSQEQINPNIHIHRGGAR